MNGKGETMIKKFTTVFTAFIITLHALPAMAVGEYYVHRDLPKVTQNDLLYKGIDISELKKNIASIQTLLKKKGNEDRIISLSEKCFSVYTDAECQYSLATLAYDRNCSEENLANLNEITDISLEVTEILSGLIYDIYESKEYSYLLELLFGDTETALYFALPDDDEIVDLLDREVKLQNRYSEIYGDTDACAELFVELVAVRNKIAEKMGYDNYAKYANAEIYGREYTDEEISEFYGAVKEYYVPLYEKAMFALLFSNGADIPMDEDDILLNARSAVRKINPELGEAFEYLIANNVYDIRPSENKNPGAGAYTLLIPRLNVPYIYINPMGDYGNNGIYNVTTLIHEFGHFASMLSTPEMEFSDAPAFLSASIDTAEIHSQGLEVLSERYYGEMFGSSASMMRYYLLCTLVGAVIDGCLFNQWQEQVYAMENPSVEKLNIELAYLIGEYYGECTPEEAQELWTELRHNYQLPMYYLSYALSASTVLGLYSESTTDYNASVDKYMRISAEGIYKTFDEIVNECRLYDIYDKAVMGKIADSTADAFALGYSDVAEGAWYIPYLYVVSNIMYGRTDDAFMPDADITRSEFVGTLGKMYDYYIGIDDKYENAFEDTKTDKNGEYISWAAEMGIVDGYNDKIFGGNDTLTREQAAAIIYRLADTVCENEDVSVFCDADAISEWAEEPVAWAVENQILNGRDNGEFAPKSSITRAETAKIIACYIFAEY